MRLRFENEELERLAFDPTHRTARWSPRVTKAYRRRIQFISAAIDDRDLRQHKSLHVEKLVGDRTGFWSLRIDQQYRLIVRFVSEEGGRVTIIIDAVDYH